MTFPDPEGSMSESSDKPGGSAAAGEFKFEQWHDVVKGDTLSKIAQKYYGDPSLYMKIFEANKNILKDPNLIKIGQRLRIP
jgi:nucleoid-associated protein YgaU